MKDPYTNDNNVLMNKLEIEDYDELNQAEADIGFLKLISVDSIQIDSLDENLIKKIHKHIFEDIFDWAGEYRTVPIYKEELVLPRYSIPYSDYKRIPEDLKNQINSLNQVDWMSLSTEEIAVTFARKIALLWKVHPFRDGNTRTILSFAYLYAREHGFPFDMETFTNELSRKYSEDGNEVIKYSARDKFVLACLDEKDYPEVLPLASIFERAMNNYNQDTQIRIK